MAASTSSSIFGSATSDGVAPKTAIIENPHPLGSPSAPRSPIEGVPEVPSTLNISIDRNRQGVNNLNGVNNQNGLTSSDKTSFTGGTAQTTGSTDDYADSGLPQSVIDMLGKLTGNQRVLADALMADYMKQQKAETKLNSERDEVRKGLMDLFNQQAGTTKSTAVTDYDKAMEKVQTSLDSGEATTKKALADHLTRTDKMASKLAADAEKDWATVKGDAKDRSADAMNVAAQSINANFDAKIRDATARAKEGNPEAQAELAQLKAAKSGALGAQLSEIKVAVGEQLNNLNMTMASLTNAARTSGATFQSYASQLNTQLTTEYLGKVLPELQATWAYNKLQAELGIEQMRLNGATSLAELLGNQQYYNTSMGGFIASLAELFSQQQAETTGSTTVGATSGGNNTNNNTGSTTPEAPKEGWGAKPPGEIVKGVEGGIWIKAPNGKTYKQDPKTGMWVTSPIQNGPGPTPEGDQWGVPWDPNYLEVYPDKKPKMSYSS
jgi:hypothetical protein